MAATSKKTEKLAKAPAAAPKKVVKKTPDVAILSPEDTEAKSDSVKKRLKKEKKAARKRMKSEVESAASSFPMVKLIDDQIKVSVPESIVARVQAAKKKELINPKYPYSKPMNNDDYLNEIEILEIELVKMQAWVKETGAKVIMIFEGRDAAGKGGTIKRFTENLNPRGARVVALTKPSENERGQWYFQRYAEQLPTSGEMVFFDRSWYNRAGVEHVMGFCSPHDYLEFMRQAPEFERMLVRSGIQLFKFWFSVSREEQLRRFIGRAKDPLKQWKLSPMDVESLARWEEYTKAKEAMLFYTDTADAPWTIVRSDDKKRARLNAMKFILHEIPYAGKHPLVTAPDPKVVGSAKDIYETGETSGGSK